MFSCLLYSKLSKIIFFRMDRCLFRLHSFCLFGSTVKVQHFQHGFVPYLIQTSDGALGSFVSVGVDELHSHRVCQGKIVPANGEFAMLCYLLCLLWMEGILQLCGCLLLLRCWVLTMNVYCDKCKYRC